MSEFLKNTEEWQDIDIAEYYLAIDLGFLPSGTSFALEAKHVFWSNNKLGHAIHNVLEKLIAIGVLEYDDKEQRVRQNSKFTWRDLSQCKDDEETDQ